MKKLLFLLIVGVTLTSCVSRKTQTLRDNILTLRDSYCKAPFKYNYDKALPSYNADSILLVNKDLETYFSNQSILVLNALGTTDEVKQIIRLKNDTSIASQLEILHLRSLVDNKITIALTELDAVAAEFDCEGERVGQMANYVEDLNNRRMNRLVILSIVLGDAATTATAIISDENSSNAVDISAGILGAGLGFMMLKPKGAKVEFIHQRNLLRDVWTGQLQSENFPPFVWYMYTEQSFSNYTEGLSIIQNIKKRWVQYNFGNDLESASNSVLYNNGGIYFAEDLHNRTSMLNQMQSATRTISQNINYVLLDLDKLTN
ncbi:MAG TPA: hypothetical protein VLY87_00130 [Flavobacterium sp.]|nr:hypothetical protein [Flavobacterium sp.]